MAHHGFESYWVEGEGELSVAGEGRDVSEVPAVAAVAGTPAAVPPFRFSRMGPKGTGKQLGEPNNRKTARAMTAGRGGFGNIPAGYTYVGQFTDHDLTFDRSTVALGKNIPLAKLIQDRSPSLDLDSLYGAGPGDPESAKFYSDGVHLKMGETVALGPPPLQAHPGFDLPRVGGSGSKAKKRKALIPDPRNDENLAVAQTHLAMIRFHNRVVDSLPSAMPDTQKFATARDIVTRHYQWMLKTDYLPRIAQPSVVTNVFNSGRKAFEVGAAATQTPTMPIEFSIAAFRLGHAMVRDAYDWNAAFPSGEGTLFFLFEFSGLSGTMFDDVRLPSNWIADWRRLYDFKKESEPQRPRAPRLGQQGDAHRHHAGVHAAHAAGRDRREQHAADPARPRVPQPAPRADGPPRHRPADGDVPQEQGRHADQADPHADPGRQERRQARRAHARPARRAADRHPVVVLHPPRGRAQQRQAQRRRGSDRRRDVPPRDGGQHLVDRPRPGMAAAPGPQQHHVPDDRPL